MISSRDFVQGLIGALEACGFDDEYGGRRCCPACLRWVEYCDAEPNWSEEGDCRGAIARRALAAAGNREGLAESHEAVEALDDALENELPELSLGARSRIIDEALQGLEGLLFGTPVSTAERKDVNRG